MNQSQEIGAAIKALRKQQKLTLYELSEKVYGAKNNYASISRIENGKWENIHFLTIHNILKALDIDLITTIQNKTTSLCNKKQLPMPK